MLSGSQPRANQYIFGNLMEAFIRGLQSGRFLKELMHGLSSTLEDLIGRSESFDMMNAKRGNIDKIVEIWSKTVTVVNKGESYHKIKAFMQSLKLILPDDMMNIKGKLDMVTCPSTPEWKRSSEFDLNGDTFPDEDDDGVVVEPLKKRDPLSEDILGATTQRDIGSYYPKRYWELLPKEMLGAITQRDTGMTYGKMEVT
ncbi:hypothetical protein Tco_0340869 [Tanacetum coccineum]